MSRVLSSIILFYILLVGSCIEPLDWPEEIEPTQRLVVEGLITTEKGPHFIYLRKTQNVIAEGEGPGVEGATVTISDGTDVFILHSEKPGVYQTDSTIRGVVGKTYVLEIQLDDQIYTANADLIPAAPLEPLEIRPWSGGITNQDAIQYFEFTYRSNFGVSNPYKYSIDLRIPDNVRDYYPDDWRVPDWVVRVLSTEDKILRDTSFYLHPGLEPPALFAYGESIYAGVTYGTIVTEKYFSMTPDHYGFIRAVMSESDWQGLGPFGYLPADVPTNLTNGALGWFAASDVAEVKQVIE